MIVQKNNVKLYTVTYLNQAKEYILSDTGKTQLHIIFNNIQKLKLEKQNSVFFYNLKSRKISLKKMNEFYIALQINPFTLEGIHDSNSFSNILLHQIDNKISYIYKILMGDKIELLYKGEQTILLFQDIVFFNSSQLIKIIDTNLKKYTNLLHIYNSLSLSYKKIMCNHIKQQHQTPRLKRLNKYLKYNKQTEAPEIVVSLNNPELNENNLYIKYIHIDQLSKLKTRGRYNNGFLLSLNDLYQIEKCDELYQKYLMNLLNQNYILFDLNHVHSSQIFFKTLRKEIKDQLIKLKKKNLFFHPKENRTKNLINIYQIILDKVNQKEYYIHDITKYTNNKPYQKNSYIVYYHTKKE